jgi:hypothetical protein
MRVFQSLSGLIAAMMLIFPAQATEKNLPQGVVELFTSQGCSSCPPADAVLNQLIDKGNVIALAFHVDYWNYIGWADTLASKENTTRQYDYAKALMQSNVYTPQVILNGRDDVEGYNINRIRTGLADYQTSGKGLVVPVAAGIENKKLSIQLGAGEGAADIVVAYFKRSTKVSIERGELAGKTMTYANSVGEIQTVGMWDGHEKTLELPLSVMEKGKYDGFAVLLQTKTANNEPSVILGAAQAYYVATQ